MEMEKKSETLCLRALCWFPCSWWCSLLFWACAFVCTLESMLSNERRWGCSLSGAACVQLCSSIHVGPLGGAVFCVGPFLCSGKDAVFVLARVVSVGAVGTWWRSCNPKSCLLLPGLPWDVNTFTELYVQRSSSSFAVWAPEAKSAQVNHSSNWCTAALSSSWYLFFSFWD